MSAGPAPPTEVARTGYQNFGSFFTDNVETMIAIPREEYVPPPRPFVPPSLEHVKTLRFGEPCRQLFMVDFNSWKFLNHGAFGGVCRPAHEEANQWREHCESQPLRFLDRELFPQMVRVMREMADFVGADPRDLVFVPNATTGLNVAIQAAGLRPGDTMYMLNIGYGSVKKMAQAASAAAAGRGAGTDPAAAAAAEGASGGEAPGGVNVVYGEVEFPIRGPDDIVNLVARTLPPNTRLAVFDSVTSNTAVRLPLRALTALCRSRGVQVLIDGAHALGQCHLDLNAGRCGGCDEGEEPTERMRSRRSGGGGSGTSTGTSKAEGTGAESGGGATVGGGSNGIGGGNSDGGSAAGSDSGTGDEAEGGNDDGSGGGDGEAKAEGSGGGGGDAGGSGRGGEVPAEAEGQQHDGTEHADGGRGGNQSDAEEEAEAAEVEIAAEEAEEEKGEEKGDEEEDEQLQVYSDEFDSEEAELEDEAEEEDGQEGGEDADGADRGSGVAEAAAAAASDPSLAVPDYFVTNCHKWLCAPRGSALLWVAPRRKAGVRPLVVSHGSGCGFTSDFIWDGCRDYAPYLATSAALALWRSLGPARVRAHMRRLLRRAARLLVDRWDTGLLAPYLAMCGPAMALVELPEGLAEADPATSTDAKYIQDLLHHNYKIEVPVKCIQGRLYVRISAHVYNTLADYEALADAIEDLLDGEEEGPEGEGGGEAEQAAPASSCTIT